MTEQEYQEIKVLLQTGVSLNQATLTPAKKLQFLRLRKKKGEARQEVSAVIREASQAANSPPLPPTSSTSGVRSTRWTGLENEPVPDTRKMLDMAKRAIYHQLSSGYFSPACLKLCFMLCEKELPEWSEIKTKAVKDQYEAILENVVKKSSGFKILERKDDGTNIKPSDENAND